MAIFGGNLLCRTSLGLQCRVLLIPWMKKGCGIRCSSGAANSSSFPVKYISKKNRMTEKLQTSPTTMTGAKDKLTTSGSDENELSVEVTSGSDENELSFEVSNGRKSSQTENVWTSFAITKGPQENISTNGLDENELRLEVSNGGKSSQTSFVLDNNSQNQNNNETPVVNQEVGNGIDFDEGVLETECFEELVEVVEELDMYEEKNLHTEDMLQVGKTKQDAENLAIELLATRAYTVVELRKKLQGKRFPLDTVDAVILDFKSRGLINDSLFAETFCQSRWSSSTWGPRRIKQALLQKGVRGADAEKAINYVFKDGDSNGEEESMLGLSKTSMDKLLAEASKQWLRGRDTTKDKRKARIIRWLQYRGFNWGVISFVVKKLESQCLP